MGEQYRFERTSTQFTILRGDSVVAHGSNESRVSALVRAANAARFPASAVLIDLLAAPVKCEDCPPINYPTDETRCSECQRRNEEAK